MRLDLLTHCSVLNATPVYSLKVGDKIRVHVNLFGEGSLEKHPPCYGVVRKIERGQHITIHDEYLGGFIRISHEPFLKGNPLHKHGKYVTSEMSDKGVLFVLP